MGNIIAEILKYFSGLMADASYDSASVWSMHQPKEPPRKK